VKASSHPITIREANDLWAKIGLAEALETSENEKGFQHGLANGKSLKHCFSSGSNA